MTATFEVSYEAVLGGNSTAVARALNLVEDRRPQAAAAIESLLSELAHHASADAGHRIGLTGPPGVGKSTLTAALARELRARQQSVGVVAVDPSSVRSGGALLGDRARMGFDPADKGLFVRSLSTAGDAGGLAYAVPAAVEVLGAAFDAVVVETTGVGQTETDVEHVVDTVCLVIQPGSGDVLQFIKAGIMEIPDVLVVNKADHGRLAQRAASDLRGALDTLRGVGVAARSGWEVPICLTSARDRQGLDGLADALAAHRASMAPEQLKERRLAGAVAWALSLFRRQHGEYAVSELGGTQKVRQQLVHALASERSVPGAVRELSESFLAVVRGPGVPSRS